MCARRVHVHEHLVFFIPQPSIFLFVHICTSLLLWEARKVFIVQCKRSDSTMSSAILIVAADLTKYLFRNYARVHKWTSRTLTYQSPKWEFFVRGVQSFSSTTTNKQFQVLAQYASNTKRFTLLAWQPRPCRRRLFSPCKLAAWMMTWKIGLLFA